MKKIVFGITSLTIGGAERVLVDIVNELNKKYDITVFTLYANGDLESEILGNVKIKSLYNCSYNEMTKLQKIFISLKLMIFGKNVYNKYIKKEKYDVEVAFLEGPITRLFRHKNTNKKIAWVHNDIEMVFGKNVKATAKKNMDKNVYKGYDNIIFVSKDNLEKFKEIYPNIKNNKLKLIYNYINPKRVMQLAKKDLNIKFNEDTLNFLTVARLVEQKGIARIIDVHKKLIDNGFKNNFYVIGEGPQEQEILQKINENNVQNTFKLLGKKTNPYPYIKKADVFCLLSHYEGYGMVIEEAKILDKFIVITNTAAREALKDYNNSKVIENTNDGIYNGLKEIIENEKSYKTKIDSKLTYDNTSILEQIEELF